MTSIRLPVYRRIALFSISSLARRIAQLGAAMLRQSLCAGWCLKRWTRTAWFLDVRKILPRGKGWLFAFKVTEFHKDASCGGQSCRWADFDQTSTCIICICKLARCQDNLKFRLISIFWLHRTAEGVSVNTVAILPGGTEALSGGNDGQVRRQGNIFIHFQACNTQETTESQSQNGRQMRDLGGSTEPGCRWLFMMHFVSDQVTRPIELWEFFVFPCISLRF